MDGDLGQRGTATVCEVCSTELDKVGTLADRELDLLRRPGREINVNLPVRMDDGSVEVFPSFRIQYNTARGPTKGGDRYLVAVGAAVTEEVMNLLRG